MQTFDFHTAFMQVDFDHINSFQSREANLRILHPGKTGVLILKKEFENLACYN